MRIFLLAFLISSSSYAIPHQRGYAAAEQFFYAIKGGPAYLTYESDQHSQGRMSIESVAELIVKVGRGYSNAIADPDFLHIMMALNKSHWIERSTYLPGLKPIHDALLQVTPLGQIENEFAQHQRIIEHTTQGLTFARKVEIATRCFFANHVWSLLTEREFRDVDWTGRAIDQAFRNEVLSLGQLNYRIASDDEFSSDSDRLRAHEVVMKSVLMFANVSTLDHLDRVLNRLSLEKRFSAVMRFVWGSAGVLLTLPTLDAVWRAPTLTYLAINTAILAPFVSAVVHKYREAYRLNTTPFDLLEGGLKRAHETCKRVL